MLFVDGIGEGFEELLVAPGAADVLGRTGTGGLEEPWVDHAGGGIVDPLDPDAVVPVIAEVIDILDRSDAGLRGPANFRSQAPAFWLHAT